MHAVACHLENVLTRWWSKMRSPTIVTNCEWTALVSKGHTPAHRETLHGQSLFRCHPAQVPRWIPNACRRHQCWHHLPRGLAYGSFQKLCLVIFSVGKPKTYVGSLHFLKHNHHTGPCCSDDKQHQLSGTKSSIPVTHSCFTIPGLPIGAHVRHFWVLIEWVKAFGHFDFVTTEKLLLTFSQRWKKGCSIIQWRNGVALLSLTPSATRSLRSPFQLKQQLVWVFVPRYSNRDWSMHACDVTVDHTKLFGILRRWKTK